MASDEMVATPTQSAIKPQGGTDTQSDANSLMAGPTGCPGVGVAESSNHRDSKLSILES